MRRFAALLTLLGLLLAANRVQAHGQRSAYLELVQSERPELWLVRVKSAFPAPDLAAVLPEACHPAKSDHDAHRGTGTERASLFRCPTSLAGQRIGIRGLNPDVPEAVLRVEDNQGHSQAARLTIDDPSFELPAQRGTWASLSHFVGLGVRHVLSGADHLLFLLLLVLSLGKFRAVLMAETAFTFSHSVSFSLTALGVVRVPASAAEACIALSLALLAVDLVGPQRMAGKRHVRAQAPLALVFGLVHGLGFAGGLREIGLPRSDAAAALVGFGVGVELGQLTFLAMALGVVKLLARLKVFGGIRLGVAYASGALACFWLFQRLDLAWPAL